MLIQNIYKENKIAEKERKKHTKALENISVHNEDFHKLRRTFPYFGYIDIEIETSKFVMFSNNDDTVAQSYFWFGPNGFEPLSLSIFHNLSRRSKFIFDIGAFTGAYSLCAQVSNPDSTVVAFEPSRSTWERAKINFVANRLGTRISLNDFALSSSSGQIEFNHYRGSLTLQSGASFIKKEGKEVYSTEVVETKTGDSIVPGYGGIDLAKIDVEGAELMVLEGLKDSIVKHRPVCIIEIEPTNIRSVTDFYYEHDYKILAIDDANRKLDEVDASEDEVKNYLAWPKEKDEYVLSVIKQSINSLVR